MYKAKIRSNLKNVESVRQKCVNENRMEDGESLLGEPVQMGGLNIVWRSSASGSRQQQSGKERSLESVLLFLIPHFVVLIPSRV